MFKDEIEVVERSVKSKLVLSKALCKDLYKPFLFTNVNGQGMKVIGNLWATRDRLARALGTDVDSLPRAILRAMKHPSRCTIGKAPFLKDSTKNVDLSKVPVPTFFKKDGGPYFTAAMIVAQDKEGNRNLSYHRLMVLDKRTLVARIVPRHLYSMYKEAKGDLKISIFVTMEPEVMLAGAMSVSYGLDELTIASALKKGSSGRQLKLVKLGNGIPVPASSQYAFEARITKRRHPEGPFVDITGTYDIVRDEPVIVVDRIYRAPDPVFPTIMPGGPDHSLMMGMPREPIILEAVEKAVPKVGSVRLTEGGCSWLHGVVSIKQQKQGDAKNAIMAAFGAHPSMKRVVVVDLDIDIFDDRQVEWAIATRFQADRDMLVIHKARGSTLDCSAVDGHTSKVGIDATIPHGRDKEFKRIDS
jgi:UbiD family decarboxylase